MSKAKLIVFSSLAMVMLFSCLELSARVWWSLKKHSLDGMVYGLRKGEHKENVRRIEGKKFTLVRDHAGEVLYYKGEPSSDEVNPVNSRGFRGWELRTDKKGVTRIVCLGGSTTYGSGQNQRDTYPQILQDKLDEKWGAHRYEVINAGQPGFNLSCLIPYTEREIISLDPDIVLVMNINNNRNYSGASPQRDKRYCPSV